MGITHKSSRASGRIYQPSLNETKRGLKTTNRRKVLHIGHNRTHLRRPQGILLPPDERRESNETWHSSASQRMDRVERCNAKTICKLSDSSIDHPMYIRTESPDLLGMSAFSIRRTVLFNCNITVFTPTDWPADVYRDARRGNWIRDRIRFENRIKLT